MRIAVDASGGEYAPHEIVKGAIKAAQEYEDLEITLVGNKQVLHVLAGRHIKKRQVTTVDAREIIDFHESPVKAVRSKPKSSIVVGINLVKNGSAAAFVSAGNTGAVLTAAFLILGNIEGVERPALCSLIDIVPFEPILLLDAGVNADCRPSHMVEFAHLGTIYAKRLLGIEHPRVGLLSNGEEEKKGNRLTQESHGLLKKTNLNFIGNIEGQDILKRTADVIVTDGFTGNIVLKTIEGLGDTFLFSLRQLGQLSSAAYRIGVRTLLHDIGRSSWVRKMDYREHGGACLLGINGNVIVAHGRSQSKAIKNAIILARQTVERGIVQAIKEHERGTGKPEDALTQGRQI